MPVLSLSHLRRKLEEKKGFPISISIIYLHKALINLISQIISFSDGEVNNVMPRQASIFLVGKVEIGSLLFSWFHLPS